MKSTKKTLGQYMTPDAVAKLIASHLPADSSCVVDLAAGDCSLLRAAAALRPQAALYGCEIDDVMYQKAREGFPKAEIRRGNGLLLNLRIDTQKSKRLHVVANPPYTETEPTPQLARQLNTAFPNLVTKLGHKRSELYFLARSLLLAKKSGGIVNILMPMGFADGDIYQRYRKSLMENYGVLKAIEVTAVFGQTEARTVLLVIDTSKDHTRKIEISRFDIESGKTDVVYRGRIAAGDRLDARFQEGKQLCSAAPLRLSDLGATVVRGRVSYKESKNLEMPAVHTSDLARATRGRLDIEVQSKRNAKANPFYSEIVAEQGDILLSRTGTRVCWKPIMVRSGRAPITDHVFRIRVPNDQKKRLTTAFSHPSFDAWLASVAKGVCATVLTKKDLMTMPIFEVPI